MAVKVRMRTIKNTIKYLNEQDPNNCLTEWALRQLIRTGKLKTVMVGRKNLINLDHLEMFLISPPEEQEEDSSEYGALRKVK